MSPQESLLVWLGPHLGADASAWLREKAAALSAGAADKTVFASFSAAIRHAGKSPLALDKHRLASAEAAVPGWNPGDWTCDEAARIYLLLALPAEPQSARLMDQLYQTADVGEAVALQKALPLLLLPAAHMQRAREGLRSNVKLIFEAVALRNPFPALHFDETGWNQLVTKCLFVESPLSQIQGLDGRANPALSRILADFAHERWAASRPFSPELWRCVGPCADGPALDDLEKTYLRGASPAEKRAAALALASCPDPRAARILDGDPVLARAVRGGSITWENLYDGQ